MIKALKKKYALSDQGAKDLLKGIVYSVLANISLMFPVILLAIVLNQLLAPVLGASAPEISAAVYTVIGIVILAVVFIFHYCQYTATYLGTYDESARRRIGLAEKLRTLPLTFFHQRDLADLTSTIMGDCANFEHAFSHTVPQFFGAVISTGIVCIGLLIFNWQMGLALLWVAPISFAIVILSRKWQEKLSKKHMNARLELAEGIQECLETVQIQLAFERLTQNKTVMMIAHRLSTIQDADLILVFKEGQIAERGTHEELVALNGIYSSMWKDYQTSIAWKVGKEDEQHD